MERLSRRTFIQASATAATLASTIHLRAQSAADKINVAVIGCRNRGWQLAQTFHRSGRFHIATVCECDDAMVEEGMKHMMASLPAKPKVEKDFRHMLDDKSIDAVAIAAPDHWHACMAVMALAAGKHVYLEKPFAYNIGDGKAIIAAAQKHPKLVLQIGTQHRSAQHIRDAGEFIAGGGVGTVGFCRCWCTHNRPFIEPSPAADPPAGFDYDMWVGPAAMQPYQKNRVHYNWHFTRNFGTGDMGNWGAHWLDTARQILKLDVPTAVAGISRKVVDDIKEWPDTMTVIYDFPSVNLLWEQRLWTTYGNNGKGGGVEVGGDKGTVLVDRGGWWFHPHGGKGEPAAHKSSPMDEPHVANFADCIAGTAKPNAPAEEGHRSAILCHLANIAAVLNRRVEFDPKTLSITNDREAAAMEHREYRSPWKLDG